jgi:hypothetical protein
MEFHVPPPNIFFKADLAAFTIFLPAAFTMPCVFEGPSVSAAAVGSAPAWMPGAPRGVVDADVFFTDAWGFLGGAAATPWTPYVVCNAANAAA